PVFGFLAFDSPKIDAFTGFPSVETYIDNKNSDLYYKKFEESPTFQEAVLISRQLAMSLRRFLEVTEQSSSVGKPSIIEYKYIIRYVNPIIIIAHDHEINMITAKKIILPN